MQMVDDSFHCILAAGAGRIKQRSEIDVCIPFGDSQVDPQASVSVTSLYGRTLSTSAFGGSFAITPLAVAIMFSNVAAPKCASSCGRSPGYCRGSPTNMQSPLLGLPRARWKILKHSSASNWRPASIPYLGDPMSKKQCKRRMGTTMCHRPVECQRKTHPRASCKDRS